MKTGSWKTYTGPGRVSISRSSPRRAPAGYRIYKTLAPGPWFNSVSRDEYIRLFAEQLAALDPGKVMTELKALAGDAEPVLMCWEVPPWTENNWCHRRLVATWFERECGLLIPELGVEELGAPAAQGQLALPTASSTRPRVRSSAPNAASKRAITYPKTAAFPPLQRGDVVPDGEHRSVAGSRGSFYTVCNHAGQLASDCPAFIFSTAPKSCKHLAGVNAEQPPTTSAR